MNFQMGFPFPIDPDNPEVQAALLRQKQESDDAEVKSLEFKEAFGKLLLKLDKTELNVLGNIFASCAADPRRAMLYFGVLNGISLVKFDTCPMCGEDHTEEMHKKMDEGLKELTGDGRNYEPKTFIVPAGSNEGQLVEQGELPIAVETAVQKRVYMLDYNFREPTEEELDEIRKLAWVPPERPLPVHMEEMALQYGVEDAWSESEDRPGQLHFEGWQCNNCGKKYPSLQDRMMKPPGIEGCDGCIHKEKWG